MHHRSRAGLWDAEYTRVETRRLVYGESLSSRLAARLLALPEIGSVEDWGCGWGGLSEHLAPWQRYCGVDGSASPFADRFADLVSYKSDADAVVLRHVLEHNPEWTSILDNALSSSRHRMVLVVFTPFAETTAVVRDYPNWAGTCEAMCDITFAKTDLTARFGSCRWTLYEGLSTLTGYGVEHMFDVAK